MIFKFLQYLLNQQKIIDNLAQSYLMKKVARYIVHKTIRVKSLTKDMKYAEFQKALKNIAEKLKDKRDKLDGKK